MTRDIRSFYTSNASLQNLPNSGVNTNLDKQAISFVANNIWFKSLLQLKWLDSLTFNKQYVSHSNLF